MIAAVEIDYKLQRRRFSLVTNIVAIIRMRTGCESSCKFLEAVAVAWMDGWLPDARPGGLSSAVLPLSLSTPTFPLSPCCLYMGMSLVRRRRQPAVYASEQVYWVAWNRCVLYRQTNIFPQFVHQSLGCVLYKCAYYIRIFTVITSHR